MVGPGPPAACLVALHVERHWVQQSTGSRTEAIRLRRRNKVSPYWVLLDIPRTTHELLFRRDLALIEAAHPHIKLALQAEGETALDKLYGLFKRHIRSGRNQCVEMVRHDDERVQEEFALIVIVKDGMLKQFRRGRDLKKAAALRRHSGNQIRPGFLGSQPHLSSIYERPVAKAT